MEYSTVSCESKRRIAAAVAKNGRFGRFLPFEREGVTGVAHDLLKSGVAMLDRISGEIERYMDLLSVRQKLVASNIANADTPGYRTRDIDFQGEFQNAMGGDPRITNVAGLAVKNDGNDVSLDRESRLLAENALRFQMASNLMRSQLRLVRSAIEEGKSA